MIAVVLGFLIVGWLLAVMFATQSNSHREHNQSVRAQQPNVVKPAAAPAPRFDEGVPAFGLK